jgi:hypothetical protein
VLAQLNFAQEFVYRAVRKSYIINPTLARPRAGREGERGTHDNGDEGVGITAISRFDTSNSISQRGEEKERKNINSPHTIMQR